MAKTLPPRSQQAWDHFREQVTALGGEVLEESWLGNKTPHHCRCPKEHECWPRPNNIQQGIGICRVCAGKDPAAAWEDFRRRVTEQWRGEVLEPKWLGANTPHLCRCTKGHECSPRPAAIQQGQGICRICVNQDPATTWKYFRKQISELGAEVLELEYLGSKVPHRCRCINGHECKPSPSSVRGGNGICLICAGKDTIVAQNNFYKRMMEQGHEVLEPEWLGIMTPHRCRCARGHECRPTPHNVQQGHGICLVCAWLAQDVLYVVRNPIMHRIKFGITSRDGYARLVNHRAAGYIEIIRLETGLPEGLAIHIEQKIKVSLASAGAQPIHGREYFKDEYLTMIINEIDNWLTVNNLPSFLDLYKAEDFPPTRANYLYV